MFYESCTVTCSLADVRRTLELLPLQMRRFVGAALQMAFTYYLTWKKAKFGLTGYQCDHQP